MNERSGRSVSGDDEMVVAASADFTGRRRPTDRHACETTRTSFNHRSAPRRAARRSSSTSCTSSRRRPGRQRIRNRSADRILHSGNCRVRLVGRSVGRETYRRGLQSFDDMLGSSTSQDSCVSRPDMMRDDIYIYIYVHTYIVGTANIVTSRRGTT